MSLVDNIVTLLWQTHYNYPSSQISPSPKVRFAYDSNENILYMGFARRGTQESSSAWIIFKFTMSGDLVTAIDSAPVGTAWQDRASGSTIYD
jgi:hypothetical protein